MHIFFLFGCEAAETNKNKINHCVLAEKIKLLKRICVLPICYIYYKCH